MKLSIQKKLFLGFGLVLTIALVTAANTLIQVADIKATEEHLAHTNQPSVVASMNISDGLNTTLAGLRGYMILGASSRQSMIFKKVRRDGIKIMDHSIDELTKHSKSWIHQEDILLLESIRKDVGQLKIAQNEIEAIAFKPENIESIKILFDEAAPEAAKIIADLSSMIDKETHLPSTPERKILLKTLADSRGSFALGLASIRAYLLSGDKTFKRNFEKKWEINTLNFENLSKKSYLFSSSQSVNWISYKKSRETFSSLPKKMFDSRSSPDWNKANHWLETKAAPLAKSIQEALEKLHKSENATMLEMNQHLSDSISFLLNAMIVGSLFAIISSVIIALYISRIITRPLGLVVDRSNEIAAGNLSGKELKISNHDELGELGNASNKMQTNLRRLISDVSKSTELLATVSNKLIQCSSSTSNVMENQQRITEQVATAMEEMSCTVTEVAKNSKDTATATKQADTEASNSRVIVADNMKNTNSLAQRINDAAKTMSSLEQDTKGVDEIVQVISSIAEQTNLLALNAAIEAARAGEQGKGFAVVADEVRVLAGRTQKSTGEIRTLLDKLKSGTVLAVAAMKQGNEQTQATVESTQKTSTSLDSITEAVAAINKMSSQIAAAADEQITVTSEMNNNILQIRNDTRNATQNTRRTDELAQVVSQHSASLHSLIKEFYMG